MQHRGSLIVVRNNSHLTFFRRPLSFLSIIRQPLILRTEQQQIVEPKTPVFPSQILFLQPGERLFVIFLQTII